jgi:hypothetical protein
LGGIIAAMSKEFGEFGLSCHKNKKLDRIAGGYDSEVFLSGQNVLKVYELNRKYRRLRDYFNVTNHAARLAENENLTLELPSSKIKLPLRVNPFLNMHVCPACGQVYGTAPFISGPILDDAVDSLKLIEYRIVLDDVSCYFEERLGVSGIRIIPINTKVLDSGLLMVTDLCSNIDVLRRKKL